MRGSFKWLVVPIVALLALPTFVSTQAVAQQDTQVVVDQDDLDLTDLDETDIDEVDLPSSPLQQSGFQQAGFQQAGFQRIGFQQQAGIGQNGAGQRGLGQRGLGQRPLDQQGAGQGQNQGQGQGVAPLDPRGNFIALCRFSHRKSDDPIVLPKQPGASHSHDFFGNLTTNAYSDYDSLRVGGTDCRLQPDESGYWVPSLTRNGATVDPLGIKVYYRAGLGTDPTRVEPFPAGFRIVAGDSHATSPQLGITRWACGPGLISGETPVTCPAEDQLDLHVRFPNCWNGTDLDSADHHSHMAYSRRGVCPAGYPKLLPELSLIVHYPISGDPGNITLASGGVYSGHADFFNAWDQNVLASKVHDCLNAVVHCGPGLIRPGPLRH